MQNMQVNIEAYLSIKLMYVANVSVFCLFTFNYKLSTFSWFRCINKVVYMQVFSPARRNLVAHWRLASRSISSFMRADAVSGGDHNTITLLSTPEVARMESARVFVANSSLVLFYGWPEDKAKLLPKSSDWLRLATQASMAEERREFGQDVGLAALFGGLSAAYLAVKTASFSLIDFIMLSLSSFVVMFSI